MSAYVVFLRERTLDATELDIYARQAPAAREGHDLTPLAFYGDFEVLEGPAIEGGVILRFPDMQAARAWYHSPAYQAARAHRFKGAEYRVVLLDGIDAPPAARVDAPTHAQDSGMTSHQIDPASAWQARYGEAAALPLPPVPAALAALLEHRSVRAYTDQPVDDEALELAIAAAQSASSSSNLQPWSVIAVRDPARRARLAELAGGQRHVAEAPLFLAWVADWSRLRRLGAAQGVATDGIDYLESYTVGVVDTALAAQNAANAFEALGLGIVYIGGMRNHPEQVAAELGLPQDSFVVFGMCVGHPDPARPAEVKPRLAQPAVLHHERYDAAGEAAAVAHYDPLMRRFQQEQQRDDRPWSQTSLQRVGCAEALMGRHRLREALNALGFALR
ncbi:TPA: nitroreductase family protein [Escherichia coli]|nr:nitroreductase family protein [Escherichia coli]